MYIYRCYHQLFFSDLRLSIPEVSGDNTPADFETAIRVRLHPSGEAAPFFADTEQNLKEYICLNAIDVGHFVISYGRAVDIYPLAGVSDAILEMWFFGVVMSTLMYQRGFFTLHACAMKVGGKVVAIIGDVGYGKSTLTASLLERGQGFLADDLTVLDFSMGYPCVLPGFPILKLTPEVAERTGFGPDRILGRHPYKGKSLYHVAPISGAGAHRLDHLFLLDRGDVMFRTLPARESFLHLNYNSLPTGRGLKSEPQHFERCTTICKNVPFTVFRRPFNMDELGEQAKQLEEFLENANRQVEVVEMANACVTE